MESMDFMRTPWKPVGDCKIQLICHSLQCQCKIAILCPLRAKKTGFVERFEGR